MQNHDTCLNRTSREEKRQPQLPIPSSWVSAEGSKIRPALNSPSKYCEASHQGPSLQSTHPSSFSIQPQPLADFISSYFLSSYQTLELHQSSTRSCSRDL